MCNTTYKQILINTNNNSFPDFTVCYDIIST